MGTFISSDSLILKSLATVDFNGSTIRTTGAFNTVLATQFTGTITLPNATSTVATLALSEAFTNKTYNGLILTATTGTLTIPNSKTLSISGGFSTTGVFDTVLATQFSGTVTLPAAAGTLIANNLGISGGSTLIGGTGASQNLTLSSTSNATKGSIILGSTDNVTIGGATVDRIFSIRSNSQIFTTGHYASSTDWAMWVNRNSNDANHFLYIRQDGTGATSAITILNANGGPAPTVRLHVNDIQKIQLGATSMEVMSTVKTSFGGSASSTIQVHIQGTTTTLSGYGLQVHNSTGTNNALIVRDDGLVGIGRIATTYTLEVQASATNNDGISLRNTAGNERARLYRAGTSTGAAVLDLLDEAGSPSITLLATTTATSFFTSKLGIGTSTSVSALTVAQIGTDDGIRLVTSGNSERGRLYVNGTTGGGVLALKNSTPTETVKISGHTNEDTYINNGGVVGIGTAAPSASNRLSVIGGALVGVSSSSTADHAFYGTTTSASNAAVRGVAGAGGIGIQGEGNSGKGVYGFGTTGFGGYFEATGAGVAIAVPAGGKNVGIGTITPVASALLDVTSTTQGVKLPNMTSAQKNAISSPAAGLVVYDTTLAKLCVYTTAWETITSL